MSLIQTKTENGVLTVAVGGRIDSTNAGEIEAEIMQSLRETSHTAVVLDAEGLAYISSAGLRIVLKVRKEEKDFKVIGASVEVYNIFEMTGFTEMIKVEKAYARLNVDGCPVIGQGAKGTVYRYNDDTVVKVYKSRDSLPAIRNERELARRAFVLGIPTAISYDIVKVGDDYASVFELLDARSVSRAIIENPEDMVRYETECAKLLKTIHSTMVGPDDGIPEEKQFIYAWYEAAKNYLTESEGEKLKKLIDDVPDTMNMLHCDYHTNNVILQEGETLLIDMDTLAHGHPIFELANIYITYVGFGEVNPAVVENFLGFSYDTAKTFWNGFLPIYLETDDKNRIREVEDKARLLSYVRHLRHIARRGKPGDPETDATVAHCVEMLRELLPRIDTLDF